MRSEKENCFGYINIFFMQKKVGCVIVDPTKGEIVSRAGDCSVNGGTCIEHACMHAVNEFQSSGSYICTGFDVFVTQEPCIM